MKLKWQKEIVGGREMFVARTIILGRQFVSYYEPGHANAREEATKDFVWFTRDFYFGGCGAAEHRFEDIPLIRMKGESKKNLQIRRRKALLDCWRESKCSKCGIIKKVNMRWPQALDDERLIRRALEVNGITSEVGR